MTGEIFAGFKGFGALLDMAKSILQISDTAKRNAIVVELTDKIRAAQDAQFALVERVSDLEKELMRFETWEREKQRYQLEKLPPGILVYSLKTDIENGDPPHKICPNCYEQRRKSILQTEWRHGPVEKMYCPACKSDFTSGEYEHSSDSSTPD